MSLATPDTDVFTQLFEDLAPPCEHSDHVEGHRAHGGPAEWIAYFPPTACGCDAETKLLCDPWKRRVWDGPHPVRLVCAPHKVSMSFEEMRAVRLEPINGKG